MNGPWLWNRESGVLWQTGGFHDDIKVGLWKRYHPNGQLYDQGEYDPQGEKTGVWETYSADGNLTRKKTFRAPAK